MSQTVMTAAFGSTDRWRGTPRGINVLADLVVGGSGVFIFHDLTSSARARIRPVDVPEADVLMAGFALVADVPLNDQAKALVAELMSPGEDIELTADQAQVLKGVVGDLAVSVVITGVNHPPIVGREDFSTTSWTVLIGTAV